MAADEGKNDGGIDTGRKKNKKKRPQLWCSDEPVVMLAMPSSAPPTTPKPPAPALAVGDSPPWLGELAEGSTPEEGEGAPAGVEKDARTAGRLKNPPYRPEDGSAAGVAEEDAAPSLPPLPPPPPPPPVTELPRESRAAPPHGADDSWPSAAGKGIEEIACFA
jgi:hypothetical protein